MAEISPLRRRMIGRNRRLAKDFENLAESLLAFVTLACIQIAIRPLARKLSFESGSNPSSTARFSKGLIRNGNRRREGALALQFQIGRGFRGSAGRGFADGRRQRDADGTQGQAGGRTRRGADGEALVVVLDLGLGQRVQIGDDLRP